MENISVEWLFEFAKNHQVGLQIISKSDSLFFLLVKNQQKRKWKKCHAKSIKGKKGKNNLRIGISCQVHKVRSS